MCPVCIATAMLIAGGATSTGGLGAIAIRKTMMSRTVNAEIGTNSNERRNQDDHEHDGEPKSSVAG
jgi:hypothetical protein